VSTNDAWKTQGHQPDGKWAETNTRPMEGSLPGVENPPPLAEKISNYLEDYHSAEKEYQEEGDEGYEDWEDFLVDNAGGTANLLAEAKAEIERLQAELEAAQSKHAIPEALRTAIDEDFASGDEPLLYVPETGMVEGWVDVIAVVDGEATRKYTMDPEGSIDWGRA